MESTSRQPSAAARLARVLVSLGVLVAMFPVSPATAIGPPSPGERVSLSSAGAQIATASYGGPLGSTGDSVVFVSWDASVVSSDANSSSDLFLRDRVASSTVRVSVSTSGTEGTGDSLSPSLSGDGSRIAFQSAAEDLVVGDDNAVIDVFVRDVSATTTVRASVTPAGGQPNDDSYYPAISRDGRYVAFTSAASNMTSGTATGTVNVYLRDLASAETTLVSRALGGGAPSGSSTQPRLSADGRFVAFESDAPDIVAGDANATWDVFVFDTVSRITTRASVGSLGQEGDWPSRSAALSDDGRCVAFESSSTLVPGDDNAVEDVFLRDLQTGTTTRVSVSTGGTQADGVCQHPSISADGRYVAFDSLADSLSGEDAPGTNDVFVHDRDTSQTVLVSRGVGGVSANGDSSGPSLSGDGTHVSFGSYASNLVPGDSNLAPDVFVVRLRERVYDRVAGASRYNTAVEASKRAFPGTSTAVVVATGRNWPDALGGSSLAGVVDGPMLLVDTHSVPASVTAEIERLEAQTAYILGGTAAVGLEVEVALEAQLGLGSVRRIAGGSRYDTAGLIAAEVASAAPAWDGLTYVATGANFPDALAVSPVAYYKTRPVVLAAPGPSAPQMPVGTSSALILGGTGAVSAETETGLRTLLGTANVDRVAGGSRYDTAALIADHGVASGLAWDGVALTTGQGFPDALSGGVMTGELGSVMLLTRTDVLPEAPETRLAENAASIVIVHILGGSGAVSDGVLDSVRVVLGD